MKGIGLPYTIPRCPEDIPEFHSAVEYNFYWAHIRKLEEGQHIQRHPKPYKELR